ncbi:hypothetical protein B1L11_44575 [Microbispora sp. GKU 823]|nr:hypothetical protein B1L11_44575 [Microbispora sp. GKU 823]
MTASIADLLNRGRSGRGVIGLGGSPLGNFARSVSDDEAAQTVRRAWDRGIRYFDTAPHYGLGLSERRIGAELRRRPRDEFVLSTKVGRLIVPNPRPREWDDDGFAVPGDLTRRWDFSATGVERSLRESLTRLGLESVDILYLHDPDQAWKSAAREGLASLARLKAAGVVKAIGVGTNTTAGLAAIIEEGLVDVIMLANRYSLLDHSALDSVLTPARRFGVAVSPSVSSPPACSPPPGPHLARRTSIVPPAPTCSGARSASRLSAQITASNCPPPRWPFRCCTPRSPRSPSACAHRARWTRTSGGSRPTSPRGSGTTLSPKA